MSTQLILNHVKWRQLFQLLEKGQLEAWMAKASDHFECKLECLSIHVKLSIVEGISTSIDLGLTEVAN